MKHYSKIELDRYLHDDMNILLRVACSKHLKNCEQCKNSLSELKNDDQVIEQIRQGIKLLNSVPHKNSKSSDCGLT